MAENTHTHITATAVKMRAVITYFNDGRLQGELYSKFFDEPFAFHSLMDMITMMETTFDTKGYPEKNMLHRTFGKPKLRHRKHELDLPEIVRERAKQKERIDTIDKALSRAHSLPTSAAGGKTCTFEISVRFRHNADWQGDIHWLEKSTTKRFSSIIDLTKLLNTALS